MFLMVLFTSSCRHFLLDRHFLVLTVKLRRKNSFKRHKNAYLRRAKGLVWLSAESSVSKRERERMQAQYQSDKAVARPHERSAPEVIIISAAI